VHSVHIIWSEKASPPANIRAKYTNQEHPSVHFVEHQTDSLNNRFRPLEGPHTDAVFAVDDDIRITCEDLTLAYEVWLGNPRTIVGFMPRIHLKSAVQIPGKPVQYEYRCWWRVFLHGAYSIILTKAAFLHHDYFGMYTNEMPAKIRELVDKERNCEDIAMQFLVSEKSQLPPVYVKGYIKDLGVLNGISTSKNVVKASHMNKRSQCLNDLIDIYQHNPLIRSHMIVYSAANWWIASPSTWAEYISSDLWKI
jgi:Glycosyl transferase family 64 domain